jgi:hypothetical protein
LLQNISGLPFQAGPFKKTKTMNFQTVMREPRDKKLSVMELAEALYEGTGHLQNLAEKLARQHGNGCQALTFFGMMGPDVKNFWMGIAQQLIDHAKEWQPNDGSACRLSDKEHERLVSLPRHPELPKD